MLGRTRSVSMKNTVVDLRHGADERYVHLCFADSKELTDCFRAKERGKRNESKTDRFALHGQDVVFRLAAKGVAISIVINR